MFFFFSLLISGLLKEAQEEQSYYKNAYQTQKSFVQKLFLLPGSPEKKVAKRNESSSYDSRIPKRTLIYHTLTHPQETPSSPSQLIA
jgi:hypothetical protein